MKTTKASARAFLDANYPSTRTMPLDWAIREARRVYANDRAYYASLNRDEATLRYEAQGELENEVIYG